MAKTPYKLTFSFINGRDTTFADSYFKIVDSLTDSTLTRPHTGEMYIQSANSAALPMGNITKARIVYIKGNVKSRIKINGGTDAIPMIATGGSATYFFLKGSTTSARLINSTIASGRYQFALVGD